MPVGLNRVTNASHSRFNEFWERERGVVCAGGRREVERIRRADTTGALEASSATSKA
jgi:hypothetical protein